MTVQIGAVHRALTSGAVRRIVGRCALAAIGGGFGAISINAFGADLTTGPLWSSIRMATAVLLSMIWRPHP